MPTEKLEVSRPYYTLVARNIRHLTNTAKAESAFILPPLSTSPPFYEKQKRCHTDALRSHLELKLRTSCREERAQINCATLHQALNSSTSLAGTVETN